MNLRITLSVVFLLFGSFVFAQGGSASTQLVYDTKNDQADNFCTLLSQLEKDAQAGFAKAKGKEIETDSKTTTWTSNIGIQGALTSSLIFDELWHYEGVLYQGLSADDVKGYYKKYKQQLEGCLSAQGYEEATGKNTDTKLEAYPDVKFSRPGGQAPPVNMRVEFEESTGIYTLAINVWQQSK